MKPTKHWTPLLLCAGLAVGPALVGINPAYAAPKHDTEYRHSGRAVVIHRGQRQVAPSDRVRRYRGINIIRPHGHWYSGYGHYVGDDDAYKWLAFTAITLKVLDNVNEAQQRAHEAAQIKATTAPVGEAIIWQEGSVSGSVTTVREGTSTAGRYCREFQHDITVDGQLERAYGTGCLQPGGSWEVVSTGAS